jgi:hypothetical protein
VVSTYDLIIEGLSVLLALSTVVVCLYNRWFVRYLFINLYLLTVASFNVGCFVTRSNYGYASPQYFYFYYTGDAIATLVGYLVIGSLFYHLLRDSTFQKFVLPTLLVFFLGVVAVSELVISRSVERFSAARFLFEFQQNMFFVGVLLSFLLWVSMAYLRAESRRFVLLVSGLGIYFSAHAVNYAFQNLFPTPMVAAALTKVPPIAYTLMVSLWLYTFLRVPEGEVAYVSQEGAEAKKPAYVVASAGRGQH